MRLTSNGSSSKLTMMPETSDRDKFVDVAVAAGADYLVTNDGHFDVLKKIDLPKVEVVSLRQFLKLFPAA